VPVARYSLTQVGQDRLAADDGIDHLTHAVVRGAQGCFGDLAEHRVLAADTLEVLDELLDDVLLGVALILWIVEMSSCASVSVTFRSRR
jgi:hypothetical protein